MASGALAADMAPAYDWSGFYAGLNAGMLIDNSNASADLSGDSAWTKNGSKNDNTSDISFTGGGMLGYNWQIDKLVLGIETDLNYGGASGDAETTYSDRSATFGTAKVTYQGDWFGTVRGRAGFAMDNVLIYGTGGLAYGYFDSKGYLDGDRMRTDNWVGVGWTAGGGVEYGIDKWSLGLEYLYVDLGSEENSGSAMDSTFKTNVDYRFSVVRATAKYNF